MKRLSCSSILVRSLTKFVCAGVLTCLFACEQVTPVPQSEIVPIKNELPRVSESTPENFHRSKHELLGTDDTASDPSTSPADSPATNPQPHKPDQHLI